MLLIPHWPKIHHKLLSGMLPRTRFNRIENSFMFVQPLENWTS